MDIERRKRINRIKKILLIIVAVAIFIPWTLCIFLFIKTNSLGKALKQAEARNAELEQSIANEPLAAVSNEPLAAASNGSPEESEPLGTESESSFDQDALLAEDMDDGEPYYIYLTFDDGPSALTEEILTVLREYNVKATFFVNGREDEEDVALYSRIVEGGHTIGMHSFSHRYDELYASEESFTADLDRIRQLIIDETGVEPVYYRFPGGSSNNVAPSSRMDSFIDILHEQGMEYIDWNIESGDASGTNPDAETIAGNVFKNFGRYHTNVVLLHDGSGHKETVKALPIIIERARNMGAELVPITEETVPIQHRN